MSSFYPNYAPEELTEDLRIRFAAPLIISTAAFMIYGVNICQLVTYFQVNGKRDRLLTKFWVGIVGILCSVSTFYQIWVNWIFSVSTFTERAQHHVSSTSGNAVVFYSSVVVLVQFFWLGCLKRMMASSPRLYWMIGTPIALAAFSSFILAIAVAVISGLDPGLNGTWPTDDVSILLRLVLALNLAADLSILIVISIKLGILKKQTLHLRTTISKLSWILVGTTLSSTLVMIAEFYISLPQPATGGGFIPIVITFGPIIPTIYAAGFFSVLNARSDLWSDKRRSQARTPNDTGSRGLIPGLRFTVDLPDRGITTQSRHPSSSEPAMTFISTRRRSGERE